MGTTYLITDATILTMDPTMPVCQAMGVKDGRVLAVGGTDEILWYRRPRSGPPAP